MYHYIGMIFILVSAVLISLTSVIYPSPFYAVKSLEPISAFIPVVFGIFVPCIFTFFGMLQKHLISDRGGNFDNTQLIYCTLFLVNSIILIFSIIYWVISGNFSLRLFYLGFIASIFDTIGKVTSLTALFYGPGGPSCAIMGLSGPFLVIL